MQRPLIAKLSRQFAAWTEAGDARIDQPEATARLFLSTISGDVTLKRLFGVQGSILEEAEIRWRLEPLFRHFEIS